MIGRSSKSNLPKVGASASSGKRERMAFTLRCASCKLRSTLVPCFRLITITEKLSCEVLLMDSTFSKEDSASSISLVTEFSTSEGEAPGYKVEIVSTGGLNLGNNS